METIYHYFLVDGNLEEAKHKVLHFLDKYQLVRYDFYEIDEDQIFSVCDDKFKEKLDFCIKQNYQVLNKFIDIIQNEGFDSLKDLLKLPQGYLSKVVHLIAHFLDGFFSIDSFFYNLIEESHWISNKLRNKLEVSQEGYYIIGVKAYFKEPYYKFEDLMPSKFML